VEELYGTRYQSGSFSLINVGSGCHCLRSFSFFFFSFHSVNSVTEQRSLNFVDIKALLRLHLGGSLVKMGLLTEQRGLSFVDIKALSKLQFRVV